MPDSDPESFLIVIFPEQVVAEEEVSSESKNLMLEGNSDGMVSVEQENVLEEQIETDVGHLELEMELNRQQVETEVVAMDTMPQSEALMATEDVVTMDTMPQSEPVLETGTVALAPGAISTEAQVAMETGAVALQGEAIPTEAQAVATEPEPAVVPLKAGSRDVKVDLAFVKVQAAAKKQVRHSGYVEMPVIFGIIELRFSTPINLYLIA